MANKYTAAEVVDLLGDLDDCSSFPSSSNSEIDEESHRESAVEATGAGTLERIRYLSFSEDDGSESSVDSDTEESLTLLATHPHLLLPLTLLVACLHLPCLPLPLLALCSLLSLHMVSVASPSSIPLVALPLKPHTSFSLHSILLPSPKSSLPSSLILQLAVKPSPKHSNSFSSLHASPTGGRRGGRVASSVRGGRRGGHVASSVRGRSRGGHAASGASHVRGRKCKDHGLHLPTDAKIISDKDNSFSLPVSDNFRPLRKPGLHIPESTEITPLSLLELFFDDNNHGEAYH